MKWERDARDQTYMANQSALLSHCLNKVHDSMSSQLKVIMGDRNKGKSSSKLQQGAENWITWSPSTTALLKQWLAPCKICQRVYLSMWPTVRTLACRDSCMDFVKAGIKQDTQLLELISPHELLISGPLLTKAEEDKCSSSLAPRKIQRFHPYSQSGRQQQDSDQKSGPPAWKQIKRHGQCSYRGKASPY